MLLKMNISQFPPIVPIPISEVLRCVLADSDNAFSSSDAEVIGDIQMCGTSAGGIFCPKRNKNYFCGGKYFLRCL